MDLSREYDSRSVGLVSAPPIAQIMNHPISQPQKQGQPQAVPQKPKTQLSVRTHVRAGGLVPATIELGKDMWGAGVKFFNETVLWGNN